MDKNVTRPHNISRHANGRNFQQRYTDNKLFCFCGMVDQRKRLALFSALFVASLSPLYTSDDACVLCMMAVYHGVW